MKQMTSDEYVARNKGNITSKLGELLEKEYNSLKLASKTSSTENDFNLKKTVATCISTSSTIIDSSTATESNKQAPRTSPKRNKNKATQEPINDGEKIRVNKKQNKKFGSCKQRLHSKFIKNGNSTARSLKTT